MKRYHTEIEELCKPDRDCSELVGIVNDVWVFNKVAQELNYEILMADVQDIGYKRTTRGIKEKRNELFQQNSVGEIIIDEGQEATVLDYMRNIKWD